MKPTSAVLLTVGCTLLGMAATSGLVIAAVVAGELGSALVVAAAAVLALLFIAPALVFAMLASWRLRTADAESLLGVRRTEAVIVALFVVGVALMVATGVAAPGVAGYLAVTVTVASGLLVAAALAGRRVGARAMTPDRPSVAGSRVDAPELRRKLRSVAVALGIALGASLAVVGVVSLATGDVSRLGPSLVFAVAIAGMTASFTATVVTWPYLLRLSGFFDGDLPLARRVRRRVLGRGGAELAVAELPVAVSWASVFGAHQLLAVVQLTGLAVGLSLVQIVTLGGSSGRLTTVLAVVSLCLFGAMLLVAVPFALVQARRARAFAAAHARELEATAR